jgi:GNAT superfamily N-acetyltransferase
MQSDGAAIARGSNEPSLDIAPLNDKDLPKAERIFRVAFGTFLGAPDPEVFWADRDYVYGRHRAPHVAAFGATIDGNLVGSNFATKWGSVGFFGPLTVRPDLQERGIAQALLARTMEQFDSWETRHVGLFTFAHSAKHIGLYQKYGFLRALSDRNHVVMRHQPPTRRCRRMVSFQRLERKAAERGSPGVSRHNRHALPWP